MAAYGYSYVPDRGFHAFARDLEEGEWKDVSTDKYDAPDQVSPLLLEAPRPVIWKLRARWSIARLDEMLAVTSDDVLRSLDAAWDSAQRAFDYTVAAAEEHEDLAVRAAASRIRRAMLKGGGTGQTALPYGAEVDFGRSQVAAARNKRTEADLKKIGALSHMKRIEATTDALAKGMGRGAAEGRAGTRSKRLREAVGACVNTFNSIHDEMVWLLEHLPPGKKRDQIDALHRPFLDLLKRYPPRASAATGGEGAAEAEQEEAEAEPAGEALPEDPS
ncbi:hypothetical protein SOCE26_042600 [Sorangium cellulosum]|uniref:Uncharacterized protein n=1 Tax=Sorangium cellulosum TaxID=56 RepID=A0A2L0EU68_SORCE|nr:hypothetical protein [Sorangium cellulosum]AUX42825.1 hypothetical protein SOCE26_042600 [Sorangium cellulosum]